MSTPGFVTVSHERHKRVGQGSNAAPTEAPTDMFVQAGGAQEDLKVGRSGATSLLMKLRTVTVGKPALPVLHSSEDCCGVPSGESEDGDALVSVCCFPCCRRTADGTSAGDDRADEGWCPFAAAAKAASGTSASVAAGLAPSPLKEAGCPSGGEPCAGPTVHDEECSKRGTCAFREAPQSMRAPAWQPRLTPSTCVLMCLRAPTDDQLSDARKRHTGVTRT